MNNVWKEVRGSTAETVKDKEETKEEYLEQDPKMRLRLAGSREGRRLVWLGVDGRKGTVFRDGVTRRHN